jgi:hypothetical protein
MQSALILAVSMAFSPAAARKCRSFSFDVAAKPQHQTNSDRFPLSALPELALRTVEQGEKPCVQSPVRN